MFLEGRLIAQGEIKNLLRNIGGGGEEIKWLEEGGQVREPLKIKPGERGAVRARSAYRKEQRNSQQKKANKRTYREKAHREDEH